MGGSLGLVVMGGDSCSNRREFESRLDGYYFSKNCNDLCLKRPKLNIKEARVGRFYLKKII